MENLSLLTYPYDHSDNIEHRHNYAYAPFQGERFLEAWKQAREGLLNEIERTSELPLSVATPYPGGEDVDTASLLEALFHQLLTSTELQEENFQDWLNWIIKRFEVSKRLYESYVLCEKNVNSLGQYKEISLYVRLAEVLACAYRRLNKVPALNALIKCLDTLYSVREDLTTDQKRRVAHVACLEREFVHRLRISVVEINQQRISPSSSVVGNGNNCDKKVLDKVTLLVADTIRSRAYAQSLLVHGFQVESIIIITSSSRSQWGQTDQQMEPPAGSGFGNIFIPDLRIPLENTCHALSARVEILDTGSVNEQPVIKKLKEIDPSLVVFSGFGGEIVHEDVLKCSGPFLHMHAGWLPDFRGSTTFYYSFLMTGNAGVSAILLSPGIDTGKIVAQDKYPLPPRDMNIDFYYDGMIRADMMIRVLDYYSIHRHLPLGRVQKEKEGETYYIVHPVIKTISTIMISKQEQDGIKSH